MFTKATPISGDTLNYYSQQELYTLYLEEGRSPTEALALSQELSKGIQTLNKREARMWQRSLREKGLWEPKKKSLEV